MILESEVSSPNPGGHDLLKERKLNYSWLLFHIGVHEICIWGVVLRHQWIVQHLSHIAKNKIYGSVANLVFLENTSKQKKITVITSCIGGSECNSIPTSKNVIII
jgi:hypothetical protein